LRIQVEVDMRAIRVHEFGLPDVLRLEELPDPQPGQGEVLVEVEVAGVHFIETRVRAGVRLGAAPLPELPYVPGREVAGTVVATGQGVDAGLVGRLVVTNTADGGGYAELATAPVEFLHEVPAGLAEGDAVALLGTGRTSLMIFEQAGVGPDDVVLVLAAAGGIGTLLLQLALEAGARVLGAAGGGLKAQLVRSLGADAAIDYTQSGWPEASLAAADGRRPTVLFEGVGGALARTSAELLAPGGRHLVYGAASGEWLAPTDQESPRRDVRFIQALRGPRAKPDEARIIQSRALALGASGRLRPVLERPFALAKASEAHAALEERRTVGKVTLNVGGPTTGSGQAGPQPRFSGGSR